MLDFISFHWLEIIHILLIGFQCGVIIWVAQQWKNQKRSERYADQCHRILQHWHNIDHYWRILIGEAVYCDGVDKHIKKFFSEEEKSVLLFKVFLRNPDLYFNKNDEESMKAVKSFQEAHVRMNTILETYYNNDSQKKIHLRDLIKKDFRERSDEEEDPKIKEEIEEFQKSLQEEHKIYQIYIKRYKEYLMNLKDALSEYAHYKKK